MAPRLKTLLPLLLVLLSISALCTTSQAKDDPQLQECKHKCSQRPRQERKQCIEKCSEQHQERGYESEREREREIVENPHGEAEKRCRQCLQQCEETQPGGAQRKQCEQRCKKQYQQEKEEEQKGREKRQEEGPQERIRQCKEECREEHGERQGRWQCEQQCEARERTRERGERDVNPRREEWGEEESEERGRENPYVFKKEHFKQKLRTEHGTVKVLKNFFKQSKLLLGIANYRLAVIELNPRTFVLPNHWDADDICYVVKGKGTITVLKQEEKQSHQIKQGDIMKVDAGSIVYVINSDSREKLIIAKLVNPVSTPGKFEAFFGAGGENPESFFRAFSNDVLEAAFNTQKDRIERVFGKQRRGPIVRASEEQIRAMTKKSSEGSHHWPFGGEGGRYGESKGTFNLFNKRPTFSNEYGELYEADSNDWRKLGDLDVRVSLANITSGSMLAPSYNSRSTKIAVVVEGQGRVEIICPHVGKESEKRSRRSRERYEEEEEEQSQGSQQGQRYHRIQSNLSVGTVFVVPAGHPTVAIASRDDNLQIMCFDVRAENNERIFLAGRNNVLKKMEREAKELAFDTSAREVDELFNSQREEAFLPGPESRHGQRGRGRDFMESILEAAVGM